MKFGGDWWSYAAVVSNALSRSLYYQNTSIKSFEHDKWNGFCIRFVKAEQLETATDASLIPFSGIKLMPCYSAKLRSSEPQTLFLSLNPCFEGLD